MADFVFTVSSENELVNYFLYFLFSDDDFFFGGGPSSDDKPGKSSKQISTGPGLGKTSRVTGRLQVTYITLLLFQDQSRFVMPRSSRSLHFAANR